MAKLKAMVIPKPNQPLELWEFDEPKLESNSVLLKTIYADVCGTDVHLYHGKLAGVPYPLIPGHVSVGKIDKIRGSVKDIDGKKFQEGDMVTFLDVHATCNNCWYCLVAKATTRCPNRKVYGITYGVQDGLSGGWSEKIYLKPGTKLLRIPKNVTPEQVVTVGCGLPTAIHAIELARIGLTNSVVIQGSGPVGLMATALAKLSGAGTIINIGAPKKRLDVAQRLGASKIIDITKHHEKERRQIVLALTNGRGADIGIECAGHPEAVRQGLDLVRDNGRYIIVGQYTDHGTIDINPHLQINKKHLEIRGCWGSDFSHVYRGLQVLSYFNQRFTPEIFNAKKYKLNDAGTALDDVENLRVTKAILKF
jgi:threonine dehydrogenase-like Zn-dependent dehydrogenase